MRDYYSTEQLDIEPRSPTVGDGRIVGGVRRSLLLLAGSAASTLLNMAVGLLIIRLVSPAEYGLVAVFIRTFAVVRFVFSLGLGAKVIEDVARAQAGQDRDFLARALSSLLSLRLGVIVLGFITLWATALILRQDYWFWVAMAATLASLFDYSSAVAQGLRRATIVASLLVFQPIIYFILVVIGNAGSMIGAQWIYVSFTGSFAIVLLVYGLLGLKADAIRLNIRDISGPYLKESRTAIIGLFSFGTLNTIFLSLGTIILGSSGLYEEAAYFSAPFSVVTLIPAVGVLVVSGSYFPEVAALAKDGDLPEMAEITKTYLLVSTGITAAVMGVFLAQPAFIVELLFTSKYLMTAGALVVMSPMTIVLFAQQICVFGLYATGHHKLAAWAMLVQVLIAGVGSFLVIWAGITDTFLGVAVAFCVASLTGFGLHTFWLQRSAGSQVFTSGVVLSGLIGGAISYLAASIMKDVLPSSIPFSLLTVALAACVGTLSSLYACLDAETKELLYRAASQG